MKKISRKPVWSKHGFSIYAKRMKSKTGKGKDRLAFRIEDASRKFRVAATLAYVYKVDIRFESK